MILWEGMIATGLSNIQVADDETAQISSHILPSPHLPNSDEEKKEVKRAFFFITSYQ